MHAFSRPFLDVLILAAGSILGISTFAWDKVKSVMAQGWLTNQGTVEFGSVEQRTIQYFNYYVARLDYSYSVNGNYYSGYKEKVYLRRKTAEGLVQSMKGQMVFIRSNPGKPEMSALLRHEQPTWPN